MVGTLSDVSMGEKTIEYLMPSSSVSYHYTITNNRAKVQYAEPIKVGDGIYIYSNQNKDDEVELYNGYILVDNNGDKYQFAGWKFSYSDSIKFIHGNEYSFFGNTRLFMILEKLG
jgi:hypothetical protein